MSDKALTPADKWASLMARTSARLALGRSGSSLPTRELLKFDLAHAQARDAVRLPFRAEEVEAALQALGCKTVQVESAAQGREIYLRRPDLGRQLSAQSSKTLSDCGEDCDIAIVIGDGLSSTAIHQNAAGFVAALLPLLTSRGYRLAPVVIAREARVALGDEIASLLKARMVVMLIGERPGLSSPDSLGAYLTFAPRPGLTDAARNCISNIRPGGLSAAEAAFKLAWLIEAAFARGVTGVDLKDESDNALRLEQGPT